MNFKNINYKRIFLNKYFLITIAFVLIITLFDKYNLRNLRKMNKELDEMNLSKQQFDKEYYHDSVTLHKLQTDPDFREKYAREHYYMKRPNEDLYIIQGDTTE